jgi:hypothetical protein
MASSILYSARPFENDREVWESLKQAIAASSGFQCWQEEKSPNEQLEQVNLDAQVSCYLRETLETLAY